MNCWTSKCSGEVKCNKQVSITWQDQRSLTDSISLISYAVSYFHSMKKCNNWCPEEPGCCSKNASTDYLVHPDCLYHHVGKLHDCKWENICSPAWRLWYNGTQVPEEKAGCTHLNCSEQGNNPARLQGLCSLLQWGTNEGEESSYSENKFILGSKQDMPTY